MEVEPRWIRGITATSLVLLAAMIVGLSVVHGQATSVIARGGGTTIIHGGTGSPGFVPVITTIAFHATRSGNSASGSFECSVHRECHVRHWADHWSERQWRYCYFDWYSEHHRPRGRVQRPLYVCCAKRRARCRLRLNS